MTEAAVKELIAGLAWGPTPSGCWIWGGPANRRGQPVVCVEGEGSLAHRVAYRVWRDRGHWLHGELRPNVPLIATCGNRRCCCPWHLEPFDRKKRMIDPRGAFNRSKLSCPRGHPYSGSNVHLRSSGRRRCRTCHAEGLRRLRAKRREAKRAEAELWRAAMEEHMRPFWEQGPVEPVVPIEPAEYRIVKVG